MLIARPASDQDCWNTPQKKPTIETKTRTTEVRDKLRGIQQGSPIAPLLANIYMPRFVLGWKMLGLEQSLGTRIVTYADDLVILCKKGKAEEALQRLA